MTVVEIMAIVILVICALILLASIWKDNSRKHLEEYLLLKDKVWAHINRRDPIEIFWDDYRELALLSLKAYRVSEFNDISMVMKEIYDVYEV